MWGVGFGADRAPVFVDSRVVGTPVGGSARGASYSFFRQTGTTGGWAGDGGGSSRAFQRPALGRYSRTAEALLMSIKRFRQVFASWLAYRSSHDLNGW